MNRIKVAVVVLAWPLLCVAEALRRTLLRQCLPGQYDEDRR